ncbi:PaeR7I family type II restriction endonuclease [Kamptonema formosum]|uniref:PaeR7I family type II restriction endonuclease n=1 Tax=Kamptonema formosum TaxID=331992 RepID=UPI00034703B4|nr:PaeR7I family type II restriction endonuclease [Oscillatoria sp. PCC 10802]
MSDVLNDLAQQLTKAVEYFWLTRERNPQAVRAGKHLDGFRELIANILIASGLQRATIYWRQKTELPGWFRAEKNWDLLVVADGKVVAIIEFKSQVGSFGNNFNNRTEEALGNATDLWAAYEEGAFKPSERPWLGYLMLLEDAPSSNQPVRVKEPHFKVFPEFKDASYAKRYQLLLTKLVRSRLYDAGCFLMSSREDGLKGEYREPDAELGFRTFVISLLGRAIPVAKMQPPGPPDPPKKEIGAGKDESTEHSESSDG